MIDRPTWLTLRRGNGEASSFVKQPPHGNLLSLKVHGTGFSYVSVNGLLGSSACYISSQDQIKTQSHSSDQYLSPAALVLIPREDSSPKVLSPY